MIGFVLTKFYPWFLIKPQIYFVPREIKSRQALSLCSFGELVGRAFSIDRVEYVAESAFFWVRPEVRNQGWGTYLFQKSVDRMNELSQVEGKVLGFTTARSAVNDQELGQRVLKYLLLQKEQENGIDEKTGLVKITGLPISFEEIYEALNYPSKI